MVIYRTKPTILNEYLKLSIFLLQEFLDTKFLFITEISENLAPI